jgi:hypothetical protein
VWCCCESETTAWLFTLRKSAPGICSFLTSILPLCLVAMREERFFLFRLCFSRVCDSFGESGTSSAHRDLLLSGRREGGLWLGGGGRGEFCWINLNPALRYPSKRLRL